jgi:ATP-binding cassette subfamily F protein 3
MLTLDQLELRFGERFIFNKISATISAGECIGLVGPNGAGKTTLLKTLAGFQGIDGGKVLKPKSLRIGYLPQDGLEAKEVTVFLEVRSAAEEVLQQEQLQRGWEAELHALPADSPRHGEILTKLAACDDALRLLGADELPSKIESILFGLGFKPEDFHRHPGELSGGWQMRLGLAKLLLQSPDLLLLDEPTNLGFAFGALAREVFIAVSRCSPDGVARPGLFGPFVPANF